MKHTNSLRNSLAKWFSLAAIISLFTFAPSKSSAQILCGAGFQYTVSGTTVQFWDSSYSTSGVHSCLWDFGNGTSSFQPNPQVNFNVQGWYYVCLTISDSASSCSSTSCDSIFINLNGGCNAYFTAITNSANTIDFDASASFFTTGPVTYSWSFGDGNVATSTQPTINHAYTSSGNYNVCLTINDASGCSSTWCNTVNFALPGVCVADFTATNNGGSTVYFTNTSSGAGAANCYWSFGDGNSSNQINPVHNYSNPGTYLVCLSIGDSTCSDTYCDSVIINASSGNCNASYSFTLSGSSIALTNTSTGNYTYATWIFGDGTSASGLSGATHTYTSAGYYTICLTIGDSSSGCQDSYCDYIFIGNSFTTYSIIGSVTENNSLIDYAIVYLIQYDTVAQSLNLIDTYYINPFDSLNGYAFYNLPAGSYLVKAAADSNAVDYATLVPTYYNNSLFWSSASFVNVGPSQYGVNINMIQGVNPGGPGFIGGLVSQGANKMEAEGDPLSGIQIMLLDMSNTAVANTYSDANGNYSFANIAYGTYKVYAEILNKVTYPAIVTIDATTPSINNVAVIVNTNNVTTATPYIDLTNIESALLYPNPVKGSATLNLNLTQAGDYTIQITDMTGRLMNAETVTLTHGENLVKLAVQNFDAGLYMVRVSDAISNFNMKLTVVK